MAQQVVITDDNGMEHVFPEGFDPKKAAAIVRHATGAPPPGSDKEGAANYEQGKKDWLQWHEPMSASAEGFVKEAPSSLYKATIGFVSGAIKTLLGPNAGMGLINDPLGTIMSAYDQAKKLPEVPAHVLKSLEDARNLAVQDPAAFGRAASDVTGAVEVGVATSKLAPTVPRSAARTVGSGIESTGKLASMPLRIGGVYKLLGGHPAGAAAMALPKAVEAGGRKLRQWGERDPKFVQKAIDDFRGAPVPPVKPTAVRINGAPAADVVDRNLGATARKGERFSAEEIKAQRATDKATEEARKVTKAEEMQEGLVEKSRTASVSVSGKTPEGEVKRGAIRFGAAKPEKGGLTPDQQKLLDGLAERNKNIGKDPRFAGTPRRTPPETPVTPAAPVPTPPPPSTPIVPEVVESGAPPKPGTDIATPVPSEPSSFVALDELSHPTGAAQNTQRFNQNRPVAEAASKAELGYPTGGRSVGPGDAPPNPAPNTRHPMPSSSLDSRITGIEPVDVERRMAVGAAPSGIERRTTPDTGGTIPEQAASIRREIPTIDTDIRGMQGRGEAARAAQAEGHLAPDKFPPGTPQLDQALVGQASRQSELDALQAQLKQEAMGKINLPSTRTRRGLSSLDTRYSEPDEQIFMDVLASNPTISGEDMVKEIIKRRVGASSTYAAGGHLDTLYNKTKGD